MLLVSASERSTRQTESVDENLQRCGVAGLTFNLLRMSQSLLEKSTIEGYSPVDKILNDV